MTGAPALSAARLAAAVRETTLVLAISLLLPFLVHLLPSWDDSPLGAHLLPIFYAPLGALLLGRTGVALAAAFLAPWLNHLLTGHPLLAMAILLNAQLVLFILVGHWQLRARLPAWLIGPLGYALALVISALPGTLLPGTGASFPLSLAAVPGILLRATPGLAILALIGWWFGRHRPHAA